MAELVREIGDVKLIVIDPITAHLGRTDSHVTAEVRGALAPLQSLAAKSGAAILLISHLNKGGPDSTAMDRVTGSGAFIAVCRSAWLVAPDPKDSENRRRMFVPIKNNLGDDKTGFAFTIEGIRLPCGIGTSRVVFEPFRVSVTADDLLQQSRPGAEDAKTVLEEACDFLRLELADGPQPATDIGKSATEAGVTKGTLARARKKLGVKAVKQGGTGPWLLTLPTRRQEMQGTQGVQETHIFGRVVTVKASELLKNGKVTVRVEALQARHAKRHDITIDALTEQLLEDRRLAYRVEQPGAAVSATMGLAKLHGLIVDRAKLNADVTITHEQALREIQASLGDAS